jgi:Histidine kinase-, DNA gyrase B-, and HSP90-like ATPase
MRVGSANPRDTRHLDDFGRFGLGLKTASFSQCRRVTVLTRQKRGPAVVRCWDLDYIAHTKEWRLLREPSPLAQRLADELADKSKGTVVVWEKLDRLTAGNRTVDDVAEDAFLRRAEHVRDHFAAVFHRLMEGTKGVKFHLNGRRIEPWDPFLTDEAATRPLPVEKLFLKDQRINIHPFVLPHLSKVDADTHRLAAGLRGWNAHQGFYIYRNRRLLVAGDWLGLKGWRQEEHYKLARIRVDLSNGLDHEWEIDVTKPRARPPEALREELVRIGECTRKLAKQVYSYRGAKLIPAEGRERVLLWQQVSHHNRVSYRLNRDHPLLQQVRAASADVPKLSALFRLIEETVPVPLITITDRERPDQTVGPFEAAKEGEILDVMRQVFAALRASGFSRKDAVSRLGSMEPFPRFPQLLQTIAEEETI